MGRLPSTWADRPILDRDPYEFYGELTLGSSQPNTAFPSATFQCTVDKPFEVHRMIPRVYAYDAEGIILPTQPDQDLLAGIVKITIKDLGLEQLMTKVATRIGALTKGSSERSWEWADPHYLTRSNGFEVTAQTVAFPDIEDLSTLVLAISFEGFLCVVAPPTNNR